LLYEPESSIPAFRGKRLKKYKSASNKTTNFTQNLRKYLFFRLKFLLDEMAANLVYVNMVKFVDSAFQRMESRAFVGKISRAG